MSQPTRTKRSSSNSRKIATPKRSSKKKRAPKKSKPAKRKRKPAKKSRSEAGKKAWRKRKMRAKLIDMMHASGWREVGLPTKDELHRWLEWGGEKLDIEIGDMYRMYWGSEVGEPTLEVWEQ